MNALLRSRRVSLPESQARFSADDFSGKIPGYVGGGRFTDDPLEVFGGAGVVEIQQMQNALLRSANLQPR
jgi:hypothetical protein